MAEAAIKINNLPANTSLHNNYLLVTQSNEANAETQKVTLAQLISFIKTKLDTNIEEDTGETVANLDLDSLLSGSGILIEKDNEKNTATIIWNPQDWVAGIEYNVGDFVIYNNYFYRCAIANSEAIWEESYWTLIGGLPDEITVKSSTDYYATLNKDNWIGSTAPYIQTLLISGLTDESSPVVDVMVSSNMPQGILEIQQWGLISRMVAKQGTITAYCYGNKPTISLNIHIKEV